jgi:hypothetical protein
MPAAEVRRNCRRVRDTNYPYSGNAPLQLWSEEYRGRDGDHLTLWQQRLSTRRTCNALESLLSEFVGERVTKCCARYDRERCCFEIGRDAGASEQVLH